MRISTATAADHEAIRLILKGASLPTKDLAPPMIASFIVARSDDAAVVATGAVERAGTDGLLRSVAVLPVFRGKGLAKQIINALEVRARSDRVAALYLLTTSAQSFFLSLGYEVLARTDAPGPVRSTPQFTELCPASSTLMVKVLDKPFNVLFLCTHNSARSILAEALLNHFGEGRFRAFSAGSMPGAAPNPLALQTLAELNLPTENLRSKPSGEFAVQGAPVMDFVITVCDNAAGEVCPVWPGQPITAHWGVEDPSLYPGDDDAKRKRFAHVAGILKRRIELLTNLPLPTLERMAVQKKLREIGHE